MAWRFLRSRKLRAFLTAMGVALGVALIAALTVLGTGLQRSITEQLRQGFGTYDVMAGYHDRLMTTEQQTQLRRMPGVTYSVGVLYLRPEANRFTYIGIGRFPVGQFAYPLKEGRYPEAAEFAAEQRIADDLGLRIGDSVTLPFRTGPREVKLVGLLKNVNSHSDVLMMNLAWLQDASGVGDQTSLLLFGVSSLTIKDFVGEEMAKVQPDLDIQLRKELDEVQDNMAGLRPMAVVFGVAGLFAAIFLVAGSFAIAVQERTRELALLRAIGAGQDQVMRMVLQEAALLGAFGGIAGVALGILGAWGAMRAAAESLGVTYAGFTVPWLWLAVEAAGGALLAVIAARGPARAAGAIPPLQAMRPDLTREAREERVGGRFGLVLLGISVCMVAGAVLLPRNSDLRALLGAFGGLFFTAGLILAQVRMLPWVVGALSRPLALLSPAVALLAGRAVLRYRKRSAMTAATLILGIMLVTSVGTVFRQIISDSGTYTRTLYLADAVVKGRSVGLADRLAAIDGVTTVVATGQELQTLLIGWDYAKADPAWSEQQRREPTVWGDDHRNLLFVVPTDLAAVSRLNRFGRVTGTVGAAEGVVVTEEQAKQWGFRLGDTLRLRTDAGFDHGRQLFRELPPVKVVAIVERSAFGARDVLVSRSLLPEGPDEAVHFSYDQARRDAVLKAVRSVLAEPAYGMTSLRDLSDALEAERQAGNQRLAIFGAVAVVIFLVAAFGLFNSMMTGFQQRLQEMAALRAAGATPAQLMWQVIVEALLVGLAGTFLGIAAGLVFAKAVAAGIGEPIYLRYGVPFFVASLVAGPLLAALAGLVPASRFATRKNPL